MKKKKPGTLTGWRVGAVAALLAAAAAVAVFVVWPRDQVQRPQIVVTFADDGQWLLRLAAKGDDDPLASAPQPQ